MSALLFPGAAKAVILVEPEAGDSFFSYQTVTFAFQREATDVEADYAFVFGKDSSLDATVSFGPQENESDEYPVEEFSMEFIASKLGRTGRLYWTVCQLDEEYLPIKTACAPGQSFHVTFRHETLTGADAQREARTVARRLVKMRPPADGVRCRRQTRIAHTCKVGYYLGDTLIYGRVSILLKRSGTYSLSYHRTRLRTYDEYCDVVNKRPLKECDEPYKSACGYVAE